MVHGNKVNAIREYYVVKANDLIREGRYNLTTQQQKIVLYAISKIQKNDNPDTLYEVSLEELCAACGIAIDESGYYYRTLKEDLRKLTNSLWVQFPDRSEWTVSWFSEVGITPMSGTVYVRFHKRIWPYLFDLHQRYTQYRLEEVLCFHGKYAIRLFEIIRSYFTQQELDEGTEKEIIIPLEKLRELLCVTVYPDWREFNRNVLKKAVDEINLLAEQLNVEYETMKEGRNVKQIRFIVSPPADFRERMRRYQKMRERLPRQKKGT